MPHPALMLVINQAEDRNSALHRNWISLLLLGVLLAACTDDRDLDADIESSDVNEESEIGAEEPGSPPLHEESEMEEIPPPSLEDLGLTAEQIEELDGDTRRYDNRIQNLLEYWNPHEDDHGVYFAELAHNLGDEVVQETMEEDWLRHPRAALIKPVYVQRENDELVLGLAVRKAFSGPTICRVAVALEDDHGTTYADTAVFAGTRESGDANSFWDMIPVGWTLVHQQNVEIPDSAPITSASVAFHHNCAGSVDNLPVSLPTSNGEIEIRDRVDVHDWITTHFSEWVWEPGMTRSVITRSTARSKPYLNVTLDRIVNNEVPNFGGVPTVAGTVTNHDYNERWLTALIRPVSTEGRMDEAGFRRSFLDFDIPSHRLSEERGPRYDANDDLLLEPESSQTFYAGGHRYASTSAIDTLDGLVFQWTTGDLRGHVPDPTQEDEPIPFLYIPLSNQ